MRNHNDEPLARNLLDEVHNLNRGLGIERTRRLIGEKYLGVVDEGSCNCDPLALTARELVGSLVILSREADTVEGVLRTRYALLSVNARYGKRELDVAEDGLVGYEVVALEDEAYTVISVHVPIPVGKGARASPVYNEVAVGVVVEAADDVEQRSLSAARGAENGDELALAKAEVNSAKRPDGLRLCDVVLFYALQL